MCYMGFSTWTIRKDYMNAADDLVLFRKLVFIFLLVRHAYGAQGVYGDNCLISSIIFSKIFS